MHNYYTITNYINEFAKRLNAYYKDPVLAEQYAWWTLETITGKTRSQLLSEKKLLLSLEQNDRIASWINALINEHMPIQYLIGNVPFCDLTITVKKPILIPRPETEHWCWQIIEQLLQYKGSEPLQILDLCSGTGCIGLACAKALPKAHIVCVDNNPQAIELGRYNAQQNNIPNVTFIQSNLFENLTGMKFDLILTNPPYISQEEYHALDKSVYLWEDKNALVADNAGYALIQKIIMRAPSFIRINDERAYYTLPQLVIEHGSTQSSFIVDLMRKAGYTHIQTHKDLSGKDRVVSGSLSHVVTEKKAP